MKQQVHIWEITCASCGEKFLHEFRAADLLRPHVFASLYFKCPKCGKGTFDHVATVGKMSIEEWEEKHPDGSVHDLPEYGE
jgi:ribosomal protein S27AE